MAVKKEEKETIISNIQAYQLALARQKSSQDPLNPLSFQMVSLFFSILLENDQKDTIIFLADGQAIPQNWTELNQDGRCFLPQYECDEQHRGPESFVFTHKLTPLQQPQPAAQPRLLRSGPLQEVSFYKKDVKQANLACIKCQEEQEQARQKRVLDLGRRLALAEFKFYSGHSEQLRTGIDD